MSSTGNFTTFKELVRKTRAISGLTGENFGKKVGVSKAQVSFWERGKGGASPESVARIAELSGIPADIVARLSDEQKESREELNLHDSLDPISRRAMAYYGCQNRSELFAIFLREWASKHPEHTTTAREVIQSGREVPPRKELKRLREEFQRKKE